MNILYAGDSEVGGAANYLLAILKSLKAKIRHVPPSRTLEPKIARSGYDAFILSDFSASHAPIESQKAIARQVGEGAGLLMVGGYGSFSGPSGCWRGSLIEKILPVTCLNRDDRAEFPSGALIIRKERHPILNKLNFSSPPVICGLNRIRPKRASRTILAARKIEARLNQGRPEIRLNPAEYPLLVVDSDPRKRIAALATDIAPHWCGGLVDWGSRKVKLPVESKIAVEVGASYLKLIQSLIRWLTKA